MGRFEFSTVLQIGFVLFVLYKISVLLNVTFKLAMKVLLILAASTTSVIIMAAILSLVLLATNNRIVVNQMKELCKTVWKIYGINIQVHEVHIGKFVLKIHWKNLLRMSSGNGFDVYMEDIYLLVGHDPKSAKEFKAKQVQRIKKEAPILVLADTLSDFTTTHPINLLMKLASFVLSLFSLSELVRYLQCIISFIISLISSGFLLLLGVISGWFLQLARAFMQKLLSISIAIGNAAILKASTPPVEPHELVLAEPKVSEWSPLETYIINHLCHVLQHFRIVIENVHIRYEDRVTNREIETSNAFLSAGVTWKNANLSLSSSTYFPSAIVLKPNVEHFSLYAGRSQLLCHLDKAEMFNQLRRGIATTDCSDYFPYYLLGHSHIQFQITCKTAKTLGKAENSIADINVRFSKEEINVAGSPQEFFGVLDAAFHIQKQICGPSPSASHQSRPFSIPSPWCLPFMKSRMRKRWLWSDIQRHRNTVKELVSCYMSVQENQAIISGEKERLKKDMERIEDIEERLDLFNIILAKEIADIRYKRLLKEKENVWRSTKKQGGTDLSASIDYTKGNKPAYVWLKIQAACNKYESQILTLSNEERVKVWAALDRNSHLISVASNILQSKNCSLNVSLGRMTASLYFAEPELQSQYLCSSFEQFETRMVYSNERTDRLSVDGFFNTVTVELIDEDSTAYPLLQTVPNKQVKVLLFTCLAEYNATTQLIHTEINASNVADVMITLAPQSISRMQKIFQLFQSKLYPKPPAVERNYWDFWNQSTSRERFSVLSGLLEHLSAGKRKFQTMKKITVLEFNLDSNLVTLILQDEAAKKLLRFDVERTNIMCKNSEQKIKIETDYRMSYYQDDREFSMLTNGDPEHLMREEAIAVTIVYQQILPYGAMQLAIDLPKEFEVTLTPHSVGVLYKTLIIFLDCLNILDQTEPLAGMSVHLDNAPKTRPPSFPVFNKAPFDIQCSISSQRWNTVQSGQCFWFQPESKKEMIVFRTTDSFAETVPLAFQDEEVNTKPVTLRLDHEYGGLRIDFISTQSLLVIVCDQLDAENVPLLLINDLDDEIEVRERDSYGRFVNDSKRCYERKGYLMAQHWRFFTWIQPNQVEKLTLYNREILLTENVMAHPFGQYDFSSNDPMDKRIIYWVTFLYGCQTVLLVTTSKHMAELLHKVKNVEPVAVRFQVHIHQMFFLLVDSEQEVLYSGITSSDPTKVAPNYQPAITFVYQAAAHYDQLDFTLYHLRVDNQLNCVHPTVFDTDLWVPRILSTYVQQRPLVQFSYIRVHSNHTGGFCYHQYTDLFIGHFTTNMEFGFLLVLDEFFGLKLFQSFFQNHAAAPNLLYQRPNSLSSRLYFGILNICIPQVTCSYSSNNPVMMHMTPLSRFLTGFAEFKDVVLCCNDFHLEDVYLSKDQFYTKLFTHYVKEGSKPFHKIAVGQDIAGNMGQLIDDIGAGLENLAHEHNAKKAFSQLIGGVFGHGANIARAIGKALEDLGSNEQTNTNSQGKSRKIKIKKKKNRLDNILTGFNEAELTTDKPVLKMFGNQGNKKSMNLLSKTAVKLSFCVTKCMTATKHAVDGSGDPVITRMREPNNATYKCNRPATPVE